MEIWGQYGLEMSSIARMDESSGYHLAGILSFPSESDYNAAQRDERTKELMDDVSNGNFTTSTPAFLTGHTLH
jgi:hypothetical protein